MLQINFPRHPRGIGGGFVCELIPQQVGQSSRAEHVLKGGLVEGAAGNEQQIGRRECLKVIGGGKQIEERTGEDSFLAPAQARNAREPLVVVRTMVRCWTLSRVNSRGELPRSNSAPPVRAARMRTPSRSPPSSNSGRARFKASASGISATGMTAAAPFANAVTMVLVARRTSKTTHTVSDKSRCGSVANSAGVKSTLSVGGICR